MSSPSQSFSSITNGTIVEKSNDANDVTKDNNNINEQQRLRRRSISFINLFQLGEKQRLGARKKSYILEQLEEDISKEKEDKIEETEQKANTNSDCNVKAKSKRFRGLFSNFWLVQKVLPAAQLSIESCDEALCQDPTMILLNVYRLNESHLGFYHTGILFGHHEYTFCQDTGIYCHDPMDCPWATYMGSVRLGTTKITKKKFQLIILEMKANGFSPGDYNVMARSCNSFTLELSKRLNLEAKYPACVYSQSRIGEMLSPMSRVIDFVPESSTASSPSLSLVSRSGTSSLLRKKKALAIGCDKSGVK